MPCIRFIKPIWLMRRTSFEEKYSIHQERSMIYLSNNREGQDGIDWLTFRLIMPIRISIRVSYLMIYILYNCRKNRSLFAKKWYYTVSSRNFGQGIALSWIITSYQNKVKLITTVIICIIHDMHNIEISLCIIWSFEDLQPYHFIAYIIPHR